jgi:inner membrane protein
MSGYFNPADLKIVDVSAEKIMLQKTAIELNWSDLKGLVENIDFKIGGTTYPLEPDMSDKGSLIALLDLNPLMGNKIPFECEFTIRGTNNISAIPLGKNTSMTVNSSWPSPKFSGNYLPDERTIDDKGFTAVWKIPQSSRPFRQAWLGSLRNFETTSFGVDFIQPVNNYTSAERTVKYALLLIALTFLCFFFIENMKGRNIHALQYTLVGLALVLFYSLLVSFSEYISFSWSYLIAGFMTSTLISTYIFAIIKDKITAISIFLTLGALYGFIYVLVLQEDFALLFGSVGLFVILAIVMNFSRKLNWGTKLHS